MTPSEQLPAPEQEILQGGPARVPLLDRLTPSRRHRGVVLIAFALGVIVGGAAGWGIDQPARQAGAPSRPVATGQVVRLVLTGVAGSTQPNDRHDTADDGPLQIDGVLLHGRGPGTATVTRIHRASGSITIRAPALPVALSVNQSFQRINLEISPRDCRLATEWTPSAQPFTLTWRDDHGDVHTDTAGDHDASMELTLLRYFDAVCGSSVARRAKRPSLHQAQRRAAA